jgi:drug/metabolite transporter (DMT)-like permease
MQQVNKKNASPFFVALAFATVYIVWGSTYFFIQRAIVSIPPFLLGALRFTIAGSIVLAWTALRGEKLFVKKDVIHAGVSGILMLFVGTGAVIWVEQYLPSAMVAIMISSGPLWFILLDRPKWGLNFRSRATIGGLVLGFAGILLLFGENILTAFSGAGDSRHLGGMGILIIGSMAWASGSLYSKYKGSGVSVSVNIAWQMLAAGIAFIPGSLMRGELQQLDWTTVSTGAWLSVAYLVVFGSIIGFSAYVWLLQVRSATQVSTHAYVNPVVAVLLGVFFANEHITMVQVFGLLTILGSVLIINLVRYHKGLVTAQKKTAARPEPVLQNMVKIVHLSEAKPVKDIQA